jgi:hypothetical protein
MIGVRTMDDYDGPDYDLEDERMEAKFERRYQAALSRHPDCRDPDHPGCEICGEGEFE